MKVLLDLLALATPAFWRAQAARRESQAFDRRYGVDTRGRVPVEEMRDVAQELTRHAVHYEASAIPKCRRALKVVSQRLGRKLREYTFVDIGSGKGLAVMIASSLPFKAAHGVEMTPALHRIAEANVRTFAAKAQPAAPIQLHCGDALQFELPPDDLVVYLYNPFDAELTQRFIGRLIDAAAVRRSAMIVAYVNPVHGRFFLDNGFRALYDDQAVVVYEYAASAAASHS